MLKKILIIAALLLPTSLIAKEFSETYKDWIFVKKGKGDEARCYIYAKAKGEPSLKRDNDPYIMIVGVGADQYQFSSSFGANLKKDGAKLMVGGKTYAMLTKGKMAWLKTDKDDKEVIDLIKNAKELKIKAETAIGQSFEDQYNINGALPGLKAVKRSCYS